ncbi:SLATT domain-containing protein [Ralstonia pseudosolanacearum]|uniref:SLATT domain-containing protein n=1 Tax=Ralstonia pseudosolanacearum TaxID=1310165 RepID=UPI002676EBF9|nr:SLATT domain-containing protein [Ralstonia pseudosolanacearum]MDO3517740.1 SLATT domain-containing protein [Ralstonia pseudosolanacearum]MDO3541025.1 SLATT domain-containing protein [Ralstonia pseudosolanacearum]
MKDFLAEMRTRAWRTAGARYNASRRLKMREWVSTCSLALLSALSIAVAFAQKTYSPAAGTPLDNYLSMLAVGVGVLLLVVSLLEWGAGYGARAEALHRNAELLTAFQIKVAQTIALLDSGAPTTAEVVNSLRVEYEEIKDKCITNHLPRDDALFRAHRRSDKTFERDGKPTMNCKRVPSTVSTV